MSNIKDLNTSNVSIKLYCADRTVSMEANLNTSNVSIKRKISACYASAITI